MKPRSALLLPLLFTALLVGGRAQAACPSGSGAGGTGHSELQGSGAGGTGVRGGDTGTGGTGFGGDTGTGGTGVLDRATSGTGGTGLLGTITGFGSICVNGLRVTYGNDVAVEVDGAPAEVGQLAIGHVVRVRAARRDGELRATHIAAESAVGGPVESFDASTGRLIVMGQGVDIDGRTRRAAPLRPGERVSVSGFRRPDGIVGATRIDARAAAAADLVTGRATRAGTRASYVGDVRAELPTAEPQGGDDRVQLQGRWDAERRSLLVDKARPAHVVATGEDRLSLEGYVERDAEGLRVHGVPVDVEDARQGSSSLRAGDRVRVEGAYRGGRLRIERLEIDPRSARMERSGPGESSSRSGRADRSGRSDRSGRGDRSDRPERPERTDRPERSERPERPERSDRSGRN